MLDTMTFKIKVVPWFFSLNSKVTQLVVGNSSGSFSTEQPLGFNIQKREKTKERLHQYFSFCFVVFNMVGNGMTRF